MGLFCGNHIRVAAPQMSTVKAMQNASYATTNEGRLIAADLRGGALRKSSEGAAYALAVSLLFLAPAVHACQRITPPPVTPHVRTMTVTAYCACRHCCGPRARGITAAGTRARHGVIAADWRVLPKGAVLHVPGYGFGRVEDKGGAIRGNRLDLFFSSHAEALRWGRREIRVAVWRVR